jgi:uncharacterized protein (UPF0333 family)
MFRGQISVEMLVLVVIVLALFIIVFVSAGTISSSGKDFRETFSNRGTCINLAFALSEVYASEDGTIIEFDLDSDAQIVGSARTIIIGQDHCVFLAHTNDASLSAGKVTISKAAGIISVV